MSEHAAGIHDLPDDQYRAALGVSNSMRKWISPPKTPLHYWAKFIAKIVPDEESEALRTGSLVHRCILQPDTMEGAFCVKPEGMNFATKEGKAWREEHKGSTIITADDAARMNGMRDSVLSHPMAKRILAGADCERSAFAKDKDILLKSRFDCVPKTGNIIADLKTCESADLDSVESAIGKYQYFCAAAFYLRVAKLLNLDRTAFVFIFVEKSPPYAVACYQLTDDIIRAGTALVNRDLDLLRECIANDSWPGYGDKILPAAVPGWMLKQLEQLAA